MKLYKPRISKKQGTPDTTGETLYMFQDLGTDKASEKADGSAKNIYSRTKYYAETSYIQMKNFHHKY